jgi:hypothetical protein
LEEGDAFVMNASTWVEIVSTLSPGILGSAMSLMPSWVVG